MEGGGGKGIWADVLASARGHQASEVNKTIVVLGGPTCGKTTLVAKLKGVDVDTITEGVAIDYTYLDAVEDDGKDDHLLGRVSLWQLSGHPRHAELLSTVIEPEALRSTVFIIALDATRPWTILSSLEEWAGIIRAFVAKFDGGLRGELSDALRTTFQTYKDPSLQAKADEDGGSGTSSSTTSTSTTTTTSSSSSSSSSSSLSSPATTSTSKAGSSSSSDLDAVVLPLPQDALVESLGVPVVIVLCKSDVVLTHASGLKDPQWDYIHYVLRRQALRYGASLVFTSAHENINVKVLWEHLLCRLFKGALSKPFTVPAQVIDRESVFVPCGWDSLTKMSPLADACAGVAGRPPVVSVEAFAAAIPDPYGGASAREASNEVPVTAEDDQVFLARFRDALAEAGEPSSGNTTPRAADGRNTAATVTRSQSSAGRAPLGSTGKTGESTEKAADFFAQLMGQKRGDGSAAGGPRKPA